MYSKLGVLPVAKEGIIKKTKKYSFKEARRRYYRIYDVLLTEIYEAGCTMVDKIFLNLIQTECTLLKTNIIKYPMATKYPRLCSQLIEKGIIAETVARKGGYCGGTECLQMLYDMLFILEQYTDLDWLLKKVFDVCVYVSDRLLKEKSSRIVAKIYCRYGIYLTKRSYKLLRAVGFFRKALILCRCETWPAEDLGDETSSNEKHTLHDCVALEMTKALVALSKTVDEPIEENNLKYETYEILKQINRVTDNLLFAEVILMEARYLREMNLFIKSLSLLSYLERHIRSILGESNITVLCELYFQQGLCFSGLSEIKRALVKFKEIRLLALEHNMNRWVGKALFEMGKVYERFPPRHNDAKLCFINAMANFSGTDKCRQQVVRFVLSRLMAKDIFPTLMRTMKKSQEQKRHLIKLYNWKNHKAPLSQSQSLNAFYITDDISYMDVKGLSKSRFEGSSSDFYHEHLLRRENAITISDGTLLHYASYLIKNERISNAL